jgi:pullulanase/glycogen debranching enzyme
MRSYPPYGPASYGYRVEGPFDPSSGMRFDPAKVLLDPYARGVMVPHTAEGDHGGPTLSLRGLDNATYYILEADRSRHANYSGTGNIAAAVQRVQNGCRDDEGVSGEKTANPLSLRGCGGWI